MSGDYVAHMLDNAPCFEDHPGVLMPNTLVTVEKDCRVPLTIINTVGEAIKLTPGAVVAYAESMDVREVMHVSVHMEDEVPKLENTYDPMIKGTPVDYLSLFNLEHVPTSQRYQLEMLLSKHRNTFAVDNSKLGMTTQTTLQIDTGNSPPVAQNPYRTPYTLRPELSR